MSKPILVFDMDGVLVDVTESYRETIARTVEHFTGAKPHARADSGMQESGRLERRLEALAPHDHDRPASRWPFEDVTRSLSGHLSRQRQRWPDPARAVGGAAGRAGKAERAVPVRASSPAGRSAEADLTLQRFAPELVFDPIVGMERREPITSPRPMACSKSSRPIAIAMLATSATRWMTRAARGPPRCRSSASRRRPIRCTSIWCSCFRGEGAYAIVDDINYLEEVFAS